jgi:rhodanese-related sulfurtransferase
MNKKVLMGKRYLMILLALAWCLPAPEAAAQTQDPAYSQLLERMYRNTGPLLTVPQAADLQAREKQVLFLDTREKAEYQVSHIKGARWVGYQDFNIQRLAGIPRQTPVVVYCSVGYRSEKIGEKLLRAGFTNVHNLYGSIFEWVNQGYPVFNDQNQQTPRVHAYSQSWGKWLVRGTKVYK